MSDLKKLGTPELSSSSSKRTALSPYRLEKRVHPNPARVSPLVELASSVKAGSRVWGQRSDSSDGKIKPLL